MTTFWMIPCAAAALLLAAPVAAQDMAASPAPTCAATPAAPPPELAAWARRAPVKAATDGAGLAAATLAPGSGVDAELTGTAGIHYVTAPEKPGGPASYGGMFALTIVKAGTYRIAIGAGAWIDVLKGKESLRASAHGHGPACTGVRKMVDFTLEPGAYVVEIAANGSPTLPLLVTLLP